MTGSTITPVLLFTNNFPICLIAFIEIKKILTNFASLSKALKTYHFGPFLDVPVL